MVIGCNLFKGDTILIKKNVSLLLDNGFSIPSFSVSGDIYLTNDSFTFHPKPYHGKRYEMYNDLIRDIVLPYDSILVVRKGSVFGGLLIKVRDKRYEFAFAGNLKQAFHKNLRSTIKMINKLKKSIRNR